MDYIVKAYKDWKLHSQFQEIVPDMDDEFMFNEKQSIRESSRTLKKYGSTCNHNLHNNETLIRHEIEKTDTLQGIALRYGCTTEQIRRANRLYASDSLFLRQFLLIPVDKSSSYFSSTTNMCEENNSIDSNNGTEYDDPLHCTTSSMSSTSVSSSSATSTENCSSMSTTLPTRPYSIAGELQQHQHQHRQTIEAAGSNCNKQSKSLDSVAAVSPDEESRRCINEFLSKIDNTISESRKYVEKSKDRMIPVSQSDHDLFASDNHLNNTHGKYGGGSSNNINNNHLRNSHHIRQSSTGSSNSDTMQLLNTTQMRRMKNSLQRLEKQQDEFFQL